MVGERLLPHGRELVLRGAEHRDADRDQARMRLPRGIDQRRADQARMALADGQRHHGRGIGGQPGRQRGVDDDDAALGQRGSGGRGIGLAHEEDEGGKEIGKPTATVRSMPN